jgi:hypothetical protein
MKTAARFRRRPASRCRSPRSTASRSTTPAIGNVLSSLRDDGSRHPVPGAAEQQLRQGHGPALRREPAPAGGVLPRPVPGARHPGHVRAAAGQGTVVQQPRRRGRGLGMRAPVRRAGLRDRQARQPLRRGPGRRLRRGLRGGVRDRPDQRLRRDHRLQRHARRGHRQGDPGTPVRRGADRAGLRAAALEVARKKANVRVLRIPHGDGRNNFDRRQAGRFRPADADQRHPRGHPRRAQGRDQRRHPRRSSSTTCCSPGASPSSSSPTPSSTPGTCARWASAPGR